jgi:hypothetical protein
VLLKARLDVTHSSGVIVQLFMTSLQKMSSLPGKARKIACRGAYRDRSSGTRRGSLWEELCKA